MHSGNPLRDPDAAALDDAVVIIDPSEPGWPRALHPMVHSLDGMKPTPIRPYEHQEPGPGRFNHISST